mgnify:CR=1 FL=1
MAAPRAGFGDYERYATLPEKASALLYALVKGHACPNGNKRLACVLTLSFLVENGQQLWTSPSELTKLIDDLAASDAGESDAVRAQTAQWIAQRSISSIEVAVRQQAGQKPGS